MAKQSNTRPAAPLKLNKEKNKRGRKAATEKQPKQPKAAFEPPADARACVAVFQKYAQKGDKKTLAYLVKESIAAREEGKRIREELEAEEVENEESQDEESLATVEQGSSDESESSEESEESDDDGEGEAATEDALEGEEAQSDEE